MAEREFEEQQGELQVPSRSGSILRQARDIAHEVAVRAGHEVRERLDHRRRGLAEGLSQVEKVAGDAAESLHDSGHDTLAVLIDHTVTRLHQAAVWLSTHTLEEMGRDVQAQLEARPVLFMAGFFVLGFGCARLLKSADASEK